MNQKQSFLYVTVISTTPEKLWETLTNPDFIVRYWFGRRNESTWKVGAPIESRSPKGELEWRGHVIENDPPRLLSFTFDHVNDNEPPSRVTFAIEQLGTETNPQGSAVRLTVTHDSFPPDSETLEDVSKGWPSILSGLKTLLETGRSLGLS
jgi:uncharacterized protein YndB with AHSA1/START domain